MIYVAFLPPDGRAPTRANESDTARRLLSHFYKKLFKEDCPDIEKTPLGKPFLATESAKSISISHSKGAVTVAVCDDGSSIGIDIEAHIEPERLERLMTRYPFIKRCASQGVSGAVTLFEASSTGGFEFTELKKEPVKESCGTFFWTETEALLKADGGGFRASKKLDELEKTHEVSSFLLGDFYISIAKQTEICK